MALPEFSMRQLLEAGVHFGHQTSRWNPKMGPYLYGSRNNIHIIDLSQTVPLLDQALKVVSDTVAGGGRLLFVGTKRQASEIISDAAKRSAQYYVNARWLGGMLTNWNTISKSIKRLREVEETLESASAAGLTKKELLMMTRERDKLERALGGIKDMGGTPDILFIIDTNKESIALQEAKKLGIPVVAILDSNCDPDNVDYPVPGNDDAARAISLYCDLFAKAALDGIARQQGASGVDQGAAVDAPVEEVLIEEIVVEEAAPAADAKADKADDKKADAKEEKAKPAKKPEAKAEKKPEAKAEKKPAAKADDKKADAKADKADDKKADKKADEKEAKPADKKPAAKAAEKKDDDSAPLFEAPKGDGDDLKKITGVGPVLEGKLQAQGVTQYGQIAGFSKADLQKLDDALNLKGKTASDDWTSQAKELAKG